MKVVIPLIIGAALFVTSFLLGSWIADSPQEEVQASTSIKPPSYVVSLVTLENGVECAVYRTRGGIDCNWQ